MSAPLWFDNLAAYSLQIVVLVATGGLLPRLFRLRAPRVMLAYWQALLALSLLLPLLEPWKPVARPTSGSPPVALIQVGPSLHAEGRSASATSVFEIVALLLLLGIVTRLGWLTLGLHRLRGYRRRARPLDPLPPALQELESALRVCPRCCLSEEIDSPVTFGQIDPVVLLPSRFLEMEGALQRAILCHEFLHVRRRDWVWNLVEETVAALFWFHPALWWLVRRIRLAREEVVDAEVLRLTRDRKPYLDALLEMAAHQGRLKPFPAPLFLSERQLAERVALLLKEVHMPKSRLIASLVAVCATLLLWGALAVRAFPLKVAPQSSKPDTAQDDPCSDRYWLPCVIQSSKPEAAQGEGLKPAFYIVPMGGPLLPLVRKVSPVYPALAMLARLQGAVVLDATVDADGSVADLKVESGHPLLVKAALDAVRQWKFAPGPQLPATTSVALHFVLTKHNWSELESDRGHFPNINFIQSGASKDYPDAARREHVEGQVLLEVTADQNGRVSDVRVLTTDSPLLTDAAVRLVQQSPLPPDWRPGLTKALVNFELNDKSLRNNGPLLPSEGRLTQAPADLLIMDQELALYPEEAQKAHLEGDVQIQLTLNDKGEVTDATVFSGPEPLQEAALKAARKWRFAPPSEGPVNVTVTYHFWLPEEAVNSAP